MLITKALLKYGLINFVLVILEETDNIKSIILKREEHFFKTYLPEYNILIKAGNSLGYKHTPQSILKLKAASLGRKHTQEAKSKISQANLGRKHTQETKSKISESNLGRTKHIVPILVTDLITNESKTFLSRRSAADYFGVKTNSLSQREKRGTKAPFPLQGEENTLQNLLNKINNNT